MYTYGLVKRDFVAFGSGVVSITIWTYVRVVVRLTWTAMYAGESHTGVL